MAFLEVGCLCQRYSVTAADPCLCQNLYSAALLYLGCMVQPPPALAIIDTHVTGQLRVKTRTRFFISPWFSINSFSHPTEKLHI